MATVDKHMLLEILSWALLLHTSHGVPKDAYQLFCVFIEHMCRIGSQKLYTLAT